VFALEAPGAFQHFDEPVALSRYVVIVPKGAPVRLVARKFDDAKVTESDIATTYSWEFKNLKEIENEVMTPPEEEFLPTVRFLSGRPTMDPVVEGFRSAAM